MINKEKLLLLLVLLLAFFLRFYKLNLYPALNADEAAIGYNAYSLIETGKDEHGNSWPINFQSFNDYKPGLYFYLVIPFIKVFGLTEWTVRAPNAFFAVATVLLVYLLVKELKLGTLNGFKKSKIEAGLVAAFLLAISPWHIHFSRGGWEVNIATFFLTLGVLMFLKALKNPRIITFVLSVVPFILSMYSYHSARIISPLLGTLLVLIYIQEVKKYLKKLGVVALIALIMLSPLIKDLTKGEITSRAAGVGLFADVGPLSRINEQRGEHNKYTGFIPRLLHNKVVNYSLAFFENWFEHYHGEFLFLSGDDIQRNKVPETGQLYLFDIFLTAVGLISLIKFFKKKSIQLIILWLALAPVASALTFQSPHALRSQNMVIPLTIISAIGFLKVVVLAKESLKYKYLLNACYLLLTTFIIWQFIRYEHMYWVHMAKEYPFSSQYGVKELVEYINEFGDNKNVLITQRYDQPYILFLFYLSYPPRKFQEDHLLTARDKYGFSTVESFDKYTFKNIEWDYDKVTNPGSLIVGTDEEIPDEANIVKKIFGINGYQYFEVVAN